MKYRFYFPNVGKIAIFPGSVTWLWCICISIDVSGCGEKWFIYMSVGNCKGVQGLVGPERLGGALCCCILVKREMGQRLVRNKRIP